MTLSIFLFPFGCEAAESCFNYGPEKVMVSGELERTTFPGAPNYENIENGDQAETDFYLKLPKPVCVIGDKQSPDAYPQEEVTSIQLVLDQKKYDELQSSIGKTINISGKLFAAHTGHHHAPALISEVSLVQGNEH